ncbi:hypothetical protein, partial [Salmonella enterica]|uniref:hypothetical protein n=1 Tax=Salmonella enterica TaxID=28901 RepID=UPI00398C5395
IKPLYALFRMRISEKLLTGHVSGTAGDNRYVTPVPHIWPLNSVAQYPPAALPDVTLLPRLYFSNLDMQLFKALRCR